jgi:hypothetical protein
LSFPYLGRRGETVVNLVFIITLGRGAAAVSFSFEYGLLTGLPLL